MNVDVAAWHAREARAYQEKLEREAEQRMSLLKQQDFNAYIEAVQEHSSKHVDSLLGDTDACLRKIMSRLHLRDGRLDALAAGVPFQLVVLSAGIGPNGFSVH